MSFALATIGALHLLVMYTITNLAAVRHLRRTGAGPAATVLPLVGAAAVLVRCRAGALPCWCAAVLVHSVLAPLVAALALVVAGRLALGGVFLIVRRRRVARRARRGI